MKIWELHGRQVGGAIRGTPDGEADVAGLYFSEKAYFLVLRDYRPAELVDLVRTSGAVAAGEALISRFAEPAARGLVWSQGMAPGPTLRRSDEVAAHAPPGRVASH